MRKSLFYGIGIPLIYFGVSLALSSLFDKATTEAFLVTFGCPLIVTFIVALITEVVSEDYYEGVDVDVKSEPYPSTISNAREVIEGKVIPLLNGTRDRSWVNWKELPNWENIPDMYRLDLLGRLVYQVLRGHYAGPYLLDHTGITYVSEDGFEIRRFEE